MNDSIVNFLGFYITAFKVMHGFDTNSSWKLSSPCASTVLCKMSKPE